MQPIFFLPEKAQDVWGKALATGKANRDPALGELEVFAGPTLAIGENVEPLREVVKPHLALYIGGMGARGRTSTTPWPPDTATAQRPTASRSLSGRRQGGSRKAVPDELVRDVSLIGTPGFVKERVAAFREAGVTTLNVVPIAGTAAERVKLIETLRGLVD